MMWYGSPVDSVIFQGGTKPLLDSDVSLEEIAHDARCESFTWVSTLLSYIQMDEGCIVTNSRWCSGVVYLDWFHWLKAECVCVSEERICRRWCERHVLTLWEFTWAQDRHTHTQVTHTHITDESPALWSGLRHRSRSTRDLSRYRASEGHPSEPSSLWRRLQEGATVCVQEGEGHESQAKREPEDAEIRPPARMNLSSYSCSYLQIYSVMTVTVLWFKSTLNQLCLLL